MVLQFVIRCECRLDTVHRTNEAEDLILNHSKHGRHFRESQ